MGELMRVDGQQLDADLTAVADAIRAQCGVTGELAFPGGFVEAIGSVGSADLLEDFLTNQLTEYENNKMTSILAYGMRGSITLRCVRMDSLDNVSSYAFQGCTGLESASFANAKNLYAGVFSGCSNLLEVNLPSIEQVSAQVFYKCTSLPVLDCHCVASIETKSFYGCHNLTAVIFRKSDAICTLKSTDAFSDTPIDSGTGYIYVPSALVESYKAANNWNNYADQIRAIEDYPEITGGAES